MVLETPILPYSQWLAENALPFFVALLVVSGVGLLLGYLAAALRHGPLVALQMTIGTLGTGVKELAETSPRRLSAIARLAFREAIRRRVLIVFAIFVIALLFAGWFLDRRSEHPARLYLSFVLTATNYLVLILAIFISAFSLPNDLKNKTIFTVVTKPVRGWEIVFGRILGFVGIGTLLLALMGLFSFFFVKRGLQHTHTVDPAQLVADPVTSGAMTGETSYDRNHRHAVQVAPDGAVTVTPAFDHSHEIARRPDQTRRGLYELGAVRGMLTARVPILGSLRFLDAAGNPGEGTNVGYEWTYRRYVEGGTAATAIWRFEGLHGEDFGDTLPLAMSIRVFRSHKGVIEEGLAGTIELVKPAPLDETGLPTARDGGLRTEAMGFTAREYEEYQPRIARIKTVVTPEGQRREVDIFKELVDPETGALEVWVRCLERGQYFGMAPADLYIRARNEPFWVNFIKGYVSIWFQMVVVTCFGVAFSTFLSGPVAMITTLSALVMGFFKGFVVDVATGEMPGGGPLESLVRILKQWNQMSELEPGLGTWIIQRIDNVLMLIVQAISHAMPNCGIFNTSRFVAYGFDIPFSLMAQHLSITVAYALVVTVAGYFFLKTREIAA
jgi:ABC-type transport system involved in multi-copper enzyme maturation permease subunit